MAYNDLPKPGYGNSYIDVDVGDTKVVVKQAQAYGLYTHLILHFNITNQITTHK